MSEILQIKEFDVNADTTTLEHEIDKHVYILYCFGLQPCEADLTPEEIAIIEQ